MRAPAAFLVLASLLSASPALAQIDIAGEWGSRIHEDLNHRGRGAELGDYSGLPLNDAGRLKATSWDASILSLPEEQAKPHPVQYHMRGPSTNLRILKVIRPYDQKFLGYRIEGLYGRADRMIWMDGRPHPPAWGEHYWQGFSTGKVVNDQLVVTTTHMKAGWIQRNGAPASYKSTLKEYFVRHGDLLMMTSILEDPVYLEEPMIRTMAWVLTPNLGIDARMYIDIADEIPERPKEYVPSYPLGTVHTDFAEEMRIPVEGMRGGSETLYPEFIPKLRKLVEALPKEGTTTKAPARGAGPIVPGRGAVESVGGHYTLPPDQVEVLQVKPNLYMLVGDSGNVTVQVGPDGVLVIDAGARMAAPALVKAIRRISDEPIRYLVNTNSSDASIGGNLAVIEAGGALKQPDAAGAVVADTADGVLVIAHENTANRMREVEPALPEEALPASTILGDRKDVFFNGEAIEVLSLPPGHSDGDVLAFFRVSDVVSAGAVIDTTGYPFIDVAHGGTSLGLLRALNRIIDITIPERNQMGGTRVIPGHGRLMNETDVVEYRNMLAIVRDRIEDLISRGMSLDQIKAVRPTLDYDGIYGATKGPWTTDMFITAIYNEFSKASQKGQ